MLLGAAGGFEKDECFGVIERVGVWVGDLLGWELSSFARWMKARTR